MAERQEQPKPRRGRPPGSGRRTRITQSETPPSSKTEETVTPTSPLEGPSQLDKAIVDFCLYLYGPETEFDPAQVEKRLFDTQTLVFNAGDSSPMLILDRLGMLSEQAAIKVESSHPELAKSLRVKKASYQIALKMFSEQVEVASQNSPSLAARSANMTSPKP